VGLLVHYGPETLIWFARYFGFEPPSSETTSKIMTLGVATFGRALVLATLKDLQALVPPLMEFFRGPKLDLQSLAQAWWVLFVSLTGIMLGIVAGLAPERPSIVTVLPAIDPPGRASTIAFIGGPQVAFARDAAALGHVRDSVRRRDRVQRGTADCLDQRETGTLSRELLEEALRQSVVL
jgi:hypothetical protein